jgi:hypothetical protein
MRSVNPTSKKEAEDSVTTLDELKAADPEHRYLLDVFEGNTLSKLGRRGDGVTHLLGALRTNPYLIAPWFDLGGAYYGSFRAREAWACWDAARATLPTHPFRSGPDKLEQRLVEEHPEFF